MKKIGKLLLLTLLAAVLALSFSAFFVSTAASVKTPQLVAVSNGKKGLVVKWKKVPGADGYIIYRRRSGASGWKRLADVKGQKKASYIDKSVKNAAEYAYCIKAFDGSKKSVSSNRISRMYSAVPKITSVKNTKDGVKLNWKKLSGTLEYRVYRKSSNQAWQRLATVGSSKGGYVDKKAKSGVRYVYQVRRVCSKAVSARDGNNKAFTFLAAPKGLDAEASRNGITLTWKSVAGADGYVVFRATQNGKGWSKIKKVTAASKTWTDKNAPKGKVSKYRLKAVAGSKTVSAYSARAKAKRLNENGKMVALTFDDGPYRPVTEQILDVLERYDSRATFFVVGSRVSAYSDCIERAASLGCEIGNHTYNHTTLTSASDYNVREEIDKTNAAIKQYTGKGASIVRAPGGSVSGRVMSLVPYPFINWSVDTMDWSHRNTSITVQNIKDNVRDGSIVLMHDLYFSTGDAAEIIVPWLIERDYQLVTVSEMMAYKGITLKAGELYTRAW